MDLSAIRTLIPEFKATFLETPKGRAHLAWFPSGRSIGRQNLAEAIKRADAGEDTTDFVLTKLLPHLDSPHNRNRGAWCYIAPAVTRDIRQWFEGAGWARSEDWPNIARLVLRFVRSVTADPSRLSAECEAFRASPFSKGMQSGFLSPILNAARPTEFSLVNSKTKKALDRLAKLECRTRLPHYPASNAVVRSVVTALEADLPEPGVPEVLAGDVFDMFCHWWVSLYEGNVGADPDEDADGASYGAADVIEGLFPDGSLRLAVCEIMSKHIELAHAHAASCWEIGLRKKRVRLNVGRLVALELTRGKLRIGLVPGDLPEDLRNQLQKEEHWSTEFITTPVTRLAVFELPRYRELESALAQSAKEFVRIAAQTGLQTPFHRFHAEDVPQYLEDVIQHAVPRPSYRNRAVPEAPRAAGEKASMERAVRFDERQNLFHKVDYSVGHLVSKIEVGEIGLPELQRPFVWDRARVRDLFDSMYRGFPVGFLLLWSNAQMRATRQVGVERKQVDVPELLVVDGQQRLTSLYAVFRCAVVFDEDFAETKIEIAFRPRDGRFEVADAANQRDPEFIPNISALWSSRGGEHRFVGSFLAQLRQARHVHPEDEDIISDNISRLQNLVNYQFTALVVQADVQEESVADIFVRINNQGVKLDQADFILTLLSVFWADGRKQLEEFSRSAKQPPAVGGAASPFNYLIQPSADQMLRASIGLGFHRGRMKAVYQILRGRNPETERFEPALRDAQFKRLQDAQPKVLDLNEWHAYLHTLRSAGFLSAETISSESSVIYTYTLYLLGKHQCGVTEPELSRLIRRWFVAALLGARYSTSPETTVDADLGDLRDARTPEEFASWIERQIGTTLTGDFWAVTLPAALDTSSPRAPQLLAFWAAQTVLAAPVLFSDKLIRDLLDPAMRPDQKALEQHHLFPRAWLKRQGITKPKRINQAPNFALLEWPKNRDLSDLPPSEYVPRVKAEFSAGRWEHMQHLHALPPGWEVMEYEHFLEARRKMMARVIQQAYLALSPSAEDDGLSLAEASVDERRVWPLVKTLEEHLRAVVRRKYNLEWGAGADEQIFTTLGKDAQETIDKNRAKHLAAYGRGATVSDILDYCYLGQLGQLMWSGSAWRLFQAAFRDKRQLEDLLKAVMPVRNDLAHFRRVPTKELERCRLAVDDLLDAFQKM